MFFLFWLIAIVLGMTAVVFLIFCFFYFFYLYKQEDEDEFFVVMAIICLVLSVGSGWSGYRFISFAKANRPAKEIVQIKQLPQKNLQPVEETRQEKQLQDLTLEQKIQNKIMELGALKRKLLVKQEKISKLLKDYQMGIKNNRKNILDLMAIKRIDSFEQAINDRKIANNLSLIQRRLAYIEKLRQINERIALGISELEYAEEESKDDLALVRVLPPEEIEKFIEEVNNILQKYQPEIKETIINIDEELLLPLEKIWQEIILQEYSPDFSPSRKAK